VIVKQRDTGSTRTLPVGIGIGMLISLVITVILSAIIAGMINGEHLAENLIDLGIIVIQLVSSAAGAWVAYSLVKSRRILVCLATGCGYYLLLLACTALFFGGQYQGMGMSALVILAGDLVIGLLGLKGNKRRTVSRRKIKNR